MKNLSRLISLAALAAAVAGCGGNAVVPENTVVAAYIDMEKAFDDGKSLAKKIVQALPSEMHDKAQKEFERAIKEIDAVRDPLNPEWAVIAFGGDFKALSREPEKCLAFAFRINADEDAVTKVLTKLVPDKDAFTSEKKSGNVIYRPRVAKDHRYIGLVDGKYLIGGSSQEAFEEMFDLYVGKGRASEEFDDLSRISGNTICRIQTAPISSLLKRFELTKHVEKFGDISQDKELSNMLLAMGPISLDIALSEGGEFVLRVECDSSDDAEMVESAFQLPAFAGRAMSDGFRYVAKNTDIMSSARMDGVADFLQSDLFKDLARTPCKASRSGKTAELRLGLVSQPVILAGALFPVISSAVLSANGNSMSIQGRKLVIGIVQANIERQGKLDPVWPRTEVTESAGKMDDVAGRAYNTSTEYFNALFDMDSGHYGSPEWDPAVDGEFLSTLWGSGVPEMTGRRLESRNIAWTVAANVTDETPDFIPVLITANFNPSLLLSKWDGRTNGSERLPIGPASGAAATPFGDKAVVIVRKSGASEVIKARHLTYDVLYNKRAFDLTNMNPPIEYLTPTGIVYPAGRK